MNAVERIQAAIDKLDKLKVDSTPGPWVAWKQYDPLRGEVYGIEACSVDIIRLRSYNRADAELIEALHRTIDAQLSILSEGLIVARHWEDILEKVSGTVRTPLTHALLIANAILGPEPH